MAHIGGVYTGRNPAFTEVEVQFIESNLSRSGLLQRFKRVLCHFNVWLDAVIAGESLDAFFFTVYPCLNVLGLLHHISGDEAVGNFVIVNQWIVIDMVSESFHKFLLAHIHKTSHILQVDFTVFVERG